MKKLMRRIMRGVCARLKVADCAAKYTLCRLLPMKKAQELWLICERGTDARDNGYAFYRYMTEHHPEIQVRYLISPDSADYPKVADHAVPYGSMENYRLLAKADKIVSTHCYTALPVKNEPLWRALRLDRRFYFLQHGIVMSDFPYVYGDRTGMRLFCCAAKPEYEFVRNTFRHPAGVVECTGLARYDQILPYKVKNQILVMPTWRRYLSDEKTFLTSEYFAAWKALLTDSRLLDRLAAAQTQLIFYPHYEMQPFLKHFDLNHPNVILADFQHYDVQQLLKESRLLITDYSSVFFDFAYMQKPCVYYQFDSEEFHRRHYREGYFSFERDAFGPVETAHNALVDQILQIAEGGYRMDQTSLQKIDAFFAYRDNHNCERIYQAIIQR